MAGGKKQKTPAHFKPQIPAHPSLEKSIRVGDTTSNRISSITGDGSASSSVNEQLEHLRRTQVPRMSVGGITNLMEQLQASPRASSYQRRPGTRAVPGPPAPRSWTEKTRVIHSGSSRNTGKTSSFEAPLSTLPGVEVPERNSLLELTLKALARNWDYHLEYDHTFLSLIPLGVKTMLLCYIARYTAPAGIRLDGLRNLFHDGDEMADQDTGASELHHLELAHSIGNNLSFQDLEKFWTLKPSRSKIKHPDSTIESTPDSHNSADAPDSWEEADVIAVTSSPLAKPLRTTLRFPSLTHLSLAHPNPNTTWASLLTFSKRHLQTLTHLSLAHWPAPTLLGTATTTSSTASNAQYRFLSHAHTTHDPDLAAWRDAAHLLRQLARNTPSLELLSLDGCHAWLLALLGLDPSAASPDAARRLTQWSASAAAAARPTSIRAGRRRWDAAFDSSPSSSPPSSFSTEPPAQTQTQTQHSGIAGPLRTGAWRRLTCVRAAQAAPPPAGAGSVPRRTLEALAGPLVGAGPSGPALPCGAAELRFETPLGEGGEGYAVRSADETVRESVDARLRRREWLAAEHLARRLEWHVNAARRAQGLPWCAVDRGWEFVWDDGDEAVRVR